MNNATQRIIRNVAGGAAAALLACTSIACRTPVAPRSAAPPSSPPAVDTKQDGPAPLAVDPRVVLTPSGGAYLVLRADPEQTEDGVAFTVMYHTGGDAEAPNQPGAEADLALAAGELLEAFGPLANVVQAERLTIVAISGKPGGHGAIEQRVFVRDARRWRPDGPARRRALPQVPTSDAGMMVRDRDEETSARDAAAKFISDADRADFDAAWARTSALAKAATSRAEFERHLAPLRHADAAGEAKLYLSIAAPAYRFLPGSFMEAWVEREAEGGSRIQVLALRLDDDLEWRIASFLEIAPRPARSVTSARPQGQPARATAGEPL